jgi:hypothetical protein
MQHLTHPIFIALFIKHQQNALNFIYVFLLWHFHVHVSVSNPAIFRVTFLLQEYSVIKCHKFLHNIDIHTNID